MFAKEVAEEKAAEFTAETLDSEEERSSEESVHELSPAAVATYRAMKRKPVVVKPAARRLIFDRYTLIVLVVFAVLFLRRFF